MTTRHSEPRRPTWFTRLLPSDHLRKGPWAVGLLLLLVGVALIVAGLPEAAGSAVIAVAVLLIIWAGGGPGLGA